MPPGMAYKLANCSGWWDYFVGLCRVWGILTAIGLWGTSVETAYGGHLLGVYMLFAALIVSVLETVFVVNFFLIFCVREDRMQFWKFWQRVIWFDNWKKGIFYLVLSVGCFIKPHQLWLAVISGVMLVISCMLYCIKTYKSRQDELVAEERSKHQTYDRFEVPDDDSIMEGMAPMPVPTHETLADQDDILDV